MIQCFWYPNLALMPLSKLLTQQTLERDIMFLTSKFDFHGSYKLLKRQTFDLEHDNKSYYSDGKNKRCRQTNK